MVTRYGVVRIILTRHAKRMRPLIFHRNIRLFFAIVMITILWIALALRCSWPLAITLITINGFHTYRAIGNDILRFDPLTPQSLLPKSKTHVWLSKAAGIDLITKPTFHRLFSRLWHIKISSHSPILIWIRQDQQQSAYDWVRHCHIRPKNGNKN